MSRFVGLVLLGAVLMGGKFAFAACPSDTLNCYGKCLWIGQCGIKTTLSGDRYCGCVFIIRIDPDEPI
jgi:hypothetical protein